MAKAKAKAKPKSKPRTKAATKLFTIGYEKAKPAAVMAELKRAKVKLLVDTRAVAASRKPGFSKRSSPPASTRGHRLSASAKARHAGRRPRRPRAPASST